MERFWLGKKVQERTYGESETKENLFRQGDKMEGSITPPGMGSYGRIRIRCKKFILTAPAGIDP